VLEASSEKLKIDPDTILVQHLTVLSRQHKDSPARRKVKRIC